MRFTAKIRNIPGKGDKRVKGITALSLQLIVCMSPENLPSVSEHWPYHLKNVDKNIPWDSLVIYEYVCAYPVVLAQKCLAAVIIISVCIVCIVFLSQNLTCLMNSMVLTLQDVLQSAPLALSSNYAAPAPAHLFTEDLHLHSEFAHSFSRI